MSQSEVEELTAKLDKLTELVEKIAYSLKGVDGSKGLIDRVHDLEESDKETKKKNKSGIMDLAKSVLVALITALAVIWGRV